MRVQLIVPDGIDDPLRPSGGNVYDRRVADGLRATGWSVVEHELAGRWPRPEPTSSAVLGQALADLPDGELVLIDGLLASANPEVIVPHAGRLRIVVLLHMLVSSVEVDGVDDLPERERAVLAAASAVITTSQFTRAALSSEYGFPADAVHAALPGSDPADPVAGSASGSRLLVVAAVTRPKGHDLLLAALAELRDLDWTCRCVGSLHLDLGFVDRLSEFARSHRLDDRLDFTGPLVGQDLDGAYRAADVLVLPSRSETYGMVATEALARGIPVIASDVGGVAEAVGGDAPEELPGLLVRPDDPAALAAMLRRWLVHDEVRLSLRQAARRRRATLTDWSRTTQQVADVLTQVASGAPNQSVEPRASTDRSSQQSALIGASRRA